METQNFNNYSTIKQYRISYINEFGYEILYLETYFLHDILEVFNELRTKKIKFSKVLISELSVPKYEFKQ